MAAEVLFRWNNATVNLKMARSVVRFLAEQHGRLAEVGPTQCLRDILDWFKTCNPDTDDSFRSLEARHGHSDDFDNVCNFLKAYDYDELRRSYPKQCGSLWMAVRGVCRRINHRTEPEQQSTSSKSSSSKESESTRGTTHMSPETYVQSIREGADEISFELLMLLSNPDTNRINRNWRDQLEHTEHTLMNALVDLRLILRSIHSSDDDMVMKEEPDYDDYNGNGKGNSNGFGRRGGGGGGFPPGSPDSNYPTSPGSSSGESGFGGRSNGSGSSSNSHGGYNWYGLEKQLESISIGGREGPSPTPAVDGTESKKAIDTTSTKEKPESPNSKRLSFPVKNPFKRSSLRKSTSLSTTPVSTPCQQSAYDSSDAISSKGGAQ